MSLAETKTTSIIVEDYIPLVKHIASRVMIGKTKYVEFEDLVGYGMIGLMDAVQKFDETKGMKFSTYAVIRIKGAMIDQLRRSSPISKGAMDKLNRYNAAVEDFQKKHYREPSSVEIADEMGVGLKDISQIENSINYISIVSLEDLIFSEEGDIQLGGAIEDEKSPLPEAIVQDEELLKYLSKAIDLLNEKDKIVISLYYYEKLTLKEIGKVLEVSESRVCQLHSRAINNIRKAFKKLNYSYVN